MARKAPTKQRNSQPHSGKTRHTPQEFDAFLAGYKDHAGTVLYLYRLWPGIRRDPSYIEKVIPPYPTSLEEHVSATHGGGDYRAILTDSNAKPMQVGDCLLQIDSLQYEPLLDPAELVEPTEIADKERAKRQISYIEHLRRNNKLPADSKFLTAAAAGPAAVPQRVAAGPAATPATNENNSSSTVKEILDFTREVMDRDSTAAELDKYAGEKVIDALTGGFQKLIALAPKDQGESSQHTAVLFQTMSGIVQAQLQTLNQQQQQLIELTQKTRQGPPVLESIEMMDKLAGAIDKFRGPTPAASGSSWVQELLSGLAPMLAPLITLFVNRATAPAPSPGAAPLIPGSLPAAPQTATPAPSPGEPPPEFFHHMALMIMNNLQQSFEGADLAHSIVVQQGQMIYLQLASLGVDGIMQRLKATAPWQAMAAIEPQVRVFVEQFVQWKDEEEGNQNETTTNVQQTPPASSTGAGAR